MGDLNGRVGNDNRGTEKYFGNQKRERKRIIDFSREIDQAFSNTKLANQNIFKFTREKHSGVERSIIVDYFLASTKIGTMDFKVQREAKA